MALALLALLVREDAAPASRVEDTVYFPSDAFPDVASIQVLLADRDPRSSTAAIRTVVIRRGAPGLAQPLLVARDDLVLVGERSGSSRSVLSSSADAAIVLTAARRVTLRGMTVRCSDPVGTALSLRSVPSPGIRSFVEDVTVQDCVLEAATCLDAGVAVSGVTVDRCVLRVTRPEGTGLLWQDGTGLFVARCRFEVESRIAAKAAVEVRGTEDPESEGRLAEKVILGGNRVQGDFAIGFDLGDTVETRIAGNRIRFPRPLRGNGEGRVGVALRRRAASTPPGDFEVSRNSIRNAHTGVWLEAPGEDGRIASNRFRGCANRSLDTRFEDTGGGLRIEFESTECRDLAVEGNDFRGLRSPPLDPAIRVSPVGNGDFCFRYALPNRWDRGRSLYAGGDVR